MKKYKLIYLIVFILIQICFLNINISFAMDYETTKNSNILDGTYVIKSVLDERYSLDVSEASELNGTNIQLYEYVKASQQKFNVKYQGDGYYTITALHSGKTLDVAWAGTKNGTNVWQHELNNTDAQKMGNKRGRK